MPFRKPPARQLRALCAEVHPDDGLDPRLMSRRELARSQPVDDRKARQLCGQVARTLADLLSGEPGADLLLGLDVVRVEPAPDAARLLVTVCARWTLAPVHPSLILAQLDRVSGRLRAGVAAAITRKRAPLLTFRVVQPGEPGEAAR